MVWGCPTDVLAPPSLAVHAGHSAASPASPGDSSVVPRLSSPPQHAAPAAVARSFLLPGSIFAAALPRTALLHSNIWSCHAHPAPPGPSRRPRQLLLIFMPPAGRTGRDGSPRSHPGGILAPEDTQLGVHGCDVRPCALQTHGAAGCRQQKRLQSIQFGEGKRFETGPTNAPPLALPAAQLQGPHPTSPPVFLCGLGEPLRFVGPLLGPHPAPGSGCQPLPTHPSHTRAGSGKAAPSHYSLRKTKW